MILIAVTVAFLVKALIDATEETTCALVEYTSPTITNLLALYSLNW